MEKLDILNILAIIGSICSILGLIISVVTSKDTIKRKIVLFFFLIVMAVSISATVYLNSELKRIKDIHKKAESVEEDYNIFGSYPEYIQEVLTFLEESKDRYPEAHERANRIHAELPEPEIPGSSDAYEKAAEEMHGIVKGVVEMNK